MSPLAFEPDASEARARSPMRAARPAEGTSDAVAPGGSSLAPIATSLDEEDELFFAEGDLASLREGTEAASASASHGTSDADAAPDVHAAILSRANERRRELGRYVAASLAVCAAVCVVAALRAGLAPADGVEAHEPPPATTATLATAAASAAPVVPVSAPEVSASTPAAKAKHGARTARDEKEAARRLLGLGKAKDAVTTAERAVALDPADADAWLVLGAAQQELRHGGSARASFQSCVKHAKRGPIAECRAMLR